MFNVHRSNLNIRRKCKSRVSAERMLPEAYTYTDSQFFLLPVLAIAVFSRLRKLVKYLPVTSSVLIYVLELVITFFQKYLNLTSFTKLFSFTEHKCT
jgi:hypothetical protein